MADDHQMDLMAHVEFQYPDEDHEPVDAVRDQMQSILGRIALFAVPSSVDEAGFKKCYARYIALLHFVDIDSLACRSPEEVAGTLGIDPNTLSEALRHLHEQGQPDPLL